MELIIFGILIILDIIYIMIIIDVILSWVSLTWFNVRIEFIKSILDPIYERIKNTFPTTFWPLDITPIILIFIIIFIKMIISSYDSDLVLQYNNVLKF